MSGGLCRRREPRCWPISAVRRALLKARSSVFIIGWDIHSPTRLVGDSGKPDDGYPEYLSDFLSALVHERPHPAVHLLPWDYSVIYATERELFPSWTFAAFGPVLGFIMRGQGRLRARSSPTRSAPGSDGTWSSGWLARGCSASGAGSHAKA
jgi:hypothetical protein